jgi:hypothetical protein
MAYNWTTEWPGVYARHDSNCPLRNGGECTCPQLAYRASAKAPDEHSRLLSPEFGTALEARDWLRDQRARLTAAVAVADEGPSVTTVIHEFLTAAERGEAHERSGADYTRPRLSQLRVGLTYVDSEMGAKPLQAVRRRHVQSLIDELHAAGLSSDRIVEVVSTLRDLFVYAIQRDLVDFNPIVQLRLPAGDGNGAHEPMATTATYAVPSMNGNGQSGYAATASAPAPQAVAVPEPAATQASTVSDQPFDDEPTYGPGMELPATEPDPPAAAPMPPLPAGTQWGPGAGPPMATPPAPPQPAAPGYPYDPPMFAPPATRMLTPLAAETHYGTPTYGADSLPTQPTVQTPRPGGEDGVFMSEQMFWWITRIVVIVFVLIALVLAAESI